MGGTESVGDTQRCPRAQERIWLLMAAACGEQEALLRLPDSEARSESRKPKEFPGVRTTRSHSPQLPGSCWCPAKGQG